MIDVILLVFGWAISTALLSILAIAIIYYITSKDWWINE
jgi:hypothetical protein